MRNTIVFVKKPNLKMKTKKNKPKTESRRVFLPKLNKQEEALAVIRDVTSKKSYYMSIIDSFVLGGKEYIVMYNYEPNTGHHPNPELVIMRTEFSETGDQLFYSIRDKNELHKAFIIFMRRFHSSDGRKGKRS